MCEHGILHAKGDSWTDIHLVVVICCMTNVNKGESGLQKLSHIAQNCFIGLLRGSKDFPYSVSLFQITNICKI